MSIVALVPHPAKDGGNPEIQRIIKEGNYTLDGLERQFGISPYLLKTKYGAKSRGRGRPAQKPKPFREPPKPTVSPAASPVVPQMAPTDAPPRRKLASETVVEPIRTPYSSSLIGAGLIILGIVAGVVGGFINWHYSYALGGQDQLISLACGFIGLVVDGTQQLLLPAFGFLSSRRRFFSRYILAPVAFVAWFPFMAGSTYAALGFVGVSVGDVIQARKAPATQRELLTAQLERTVKLRNAIMEIGDQKMLENRMNAALGAIPRRNRESSDDCKNPTQNFSAAVCADYVWLKGAWTAAKSRDDDDALIASLTAQLKALPATGAANPAAEQLAQITDGKINSEQATNYQIRWLAVVPGSSSILLTIGLALL